MHLSGGGVWVDGWVELEEAEVVDRRLGEGGGFVDSVLWFSILANKYMMDENRSSHDLYDASETLQTHS